MKTLPGGRMFSMIRAETILEEHALPPSHACARGARRLFARR
jgi:hypothetical protein